MKVFVFNSEKCNGCYNCQIACKDEHVDNDWPPYAKPQPDTGHFWLKLNEKEHGQAPKVRIEYTPISCMHCDKPACKSAAEGMVYKREDGLVIIDPDKAKGAKALVDSCPYGAIYWNAALDIPQKCTGCAHLVDEGKLPHCVDLCATGAWRFGEEEEFADEIGCAEIMLPEAGQEPRVYYLNMPKLFIGGEVWDPKENEIIEGASITLKNEGDGAVLETTSDGFGDFWFRRLEPGRYTLSIKAEGFMEQTKAGINLSESLNVGDFPLQRS